MYAGYFISKWLAYSECIIRFLVGDPRRETLANELQEEEAVLKQCLEKLKVVEANRASLVSQLKEALHEQVSLCYFYILYHSACCRF